jgi:two-component system CheB/CheR fusion protein
LAHPRRYRGAGSFFDALPADSDCAFVVVLHLDPKRKSEMAHILGTRTAMPVALVDDGMRIAANHVYVIAPDTDLAVHDGSLRMSKPSKPHGQRHPSMCSLPRLPPSSANARLRSFSPT